MRGRSSRDEVVQIEDVPQSSIGAPLPVLLSDEQRVVLAYLLEEPDPSWDGTEVRVVDQQSEGAIAIVTFDGYASYRFGMPNDEAFHGHPLASRGLGPYRVFEVRRSSWVRELERMNSVHPQHRPEDFDALKHFVFAFHDSTFECAARAFEIEIVRGTLEGVLPRMQELLGW
ncbi:MAG: hypothetical protein ACRDNI_07325 [Gaiellaceae bacterium]